MLHTSVNEANQKPARWTVVDEVLTALGVAALNASAEVSVQKSLSKLTNLS